MRMQEILVFSTMDILSKTSAMRVESGYAVVLEMGVQSCG